jgi:ABC-type Fe3+ transport system substrate-binding protein
MTTSASKVVAASLSALVLTGAVQARAMTVDEIANYSKPDRQKVLEELAKKEGELLWIGGLNEKTATLPILDAFKKKYPYINGKAIRTNDAEGVQRVLAEYRAKTPRVDLFNGSVILDLKKAGLAQKFYSPTVEALPEDFKDPERFYATVRYTYHDVVSYNTTLIKPAEAPKTFDELLDPKWKGKMVGTNSGETGMPFLITYLRKTWGDQRTETWLQKMSKQDVKISGSSIRNVLDLVAAGEYPMLINGAMHHVGQSRASGAPVDATMVDPVLARNGYIVMLNTSPHPASSMLLIDFLLDDTAQNILKAEAFYPARPDIPPLDEMKAYTPVAKGYKQFPVDDQMIFDLGKSSMEMFSKYFQ